MKANELALHSIIVSEYNKQMQQSDENLHMAETSDHSDHFIQLSYKNIIKASVLKDILKRVTVK